MPDLPDTQVLWQLLTGGLLAGLELCPQSATGPSSLHEARPQTTSKPRQLPLDDDNMSSKPHSDIQLTEAYPDALPPSVGQLMQERWRVQPQDNMLVMQHEKGSRQGCRTSA